MRRCLLFVYFSLAGLLWGAEPPAEFIAALDRLQTDAPKGWGFTQTTTAEGRSRVERYDAIGPEPARWKLLQVDGREPTEAELGDYRKGQVLRAGGEGSPNVKNQIDRSTGELLSNDGERAVWRFRLQPSEDDTWAEHMAATFTLHRASGVIEQVELASLAPFSPMFFTQVHEARTTMHYSLPEAGRPSLLQAIEVRMRGRAWVFRSLDSEMTVRFSDYRYMGKL